MPTAIEEFGKALQENQSLYGVQLPNAARDSLARYYKLLLKWNARLHLVAPCSPEEFATRHVLESLMLLRHLSPDARVVDIGSGGGLPMIPCLIARDDIRAILVESSARKAIFLREALRTVDCEKRGKVIARQFQTTRTPDVDFVTCRALDKFETLLPTLIDWSPAASTLLLFAGEDLVKKLKDLMSVVAIEKMPKSERRFLFVGRRR